MSYALSQPQIDTLTTFAESNNFAAMYSEIYNIMGQPDVNGASADPMVREWFRAAAEANTGTGPAADLIRDYTAAQIFQRTGQVIDPQHMQDASNALAQALFIEYVLAGTLPTLENIAQTDKQEIIDSLNSNGYAVDDAVWSGNLLFVGLGEDGPLNDGLLSDSRYTYDLFAAASAMQSVGLVTTATSTWDSVWANLGFPLSTAANAASSIDQFLTAAYGEWAPTSLQLFGFGILGSVIVDRQGDHDGIIPHDFGTHDDFVNAGAGNDEFVGTFGNDLLDGGAGYDEISFEAESNTPDDVSIDLFLQSDGTQGVPFSGVAIWGNGGQDQSILFNIESVTLGVNDDVLHVREPNFVTSVNGSENGYLGDTVHAGESPYDVQINLSIGTVTIDEDITNISNFENAVGSGGQDELVGDSGANILIGGDGADTIDGGDGDDIIVFDAADIVGGAAPSFPTGGDGFDIAQSFDTADIELDMTASQFEVIVAGSGDDTIRNIGGSGDAGDVVAGGDGNDTFYISNESASSVIWGGAGADTFYFGDTANILAVNVAGLTTENISDFGLDLLGFDFDFDWSTFDAIILNPDASDEYFYEPSGSSGPVQLGTTSFNFQIWASDEVRFEIEEVIESAPTNIGSVSYTTTLEAHAKYLDNLQTEETPTQAAAGTVAVGNFDATYLGPRLNTVQTAVGVALNQDIESTGQDDATLNITTVFVEEEYEEEDTNYFDLQFFSPGVGRVSTLDQVGTFTARNQLASWSVAGGGFNGSNLSTNGALSITMPTYEGPTLFEMLNSLDPNLGGTPQSDDNSTNGQTGSDGEDRFGFATGSGTTVVSEFSVDEDSVEIDGVLFDPTDPPEGTSVSQQGLNTKISFGNGDEIILVDVDLVDWGYSVIRLLQGTPGDDTVYGDDGDNPIDALGGDDFIFALAGDDTIRASEGADTIDGGEGFDTIDFTTSTEAVSVDLHLGAGLGGTAEGDHYTSIEAVVGSSFDDAISGANISDALNGGAGNDTINARGGDDTIVYDSGNDQIIGGTGFDTLDLSKYSSDQVSFRIAGNDVFIQTPDGEIELHNQVRYEVGNSRGNIGDIIFSDVTFSEAEVKERSLADQSTSGSDEIFGSNLNDMISDATGNDTINARGGDDTIVYDSGNDQIIGGTGFDTLDLSKYSSDQVSFRIAGNDVFIQTPDGEIELHNQVRYETGHEKTNIELIQFNNISLDHDGIQRWIDGQAFDSYTTNVAGSDFNVELDFSGSWTLALQTPVIQAARYISSIIIGDVADVGSIDDIHVDIGLAYIDGDQGTIGRGGPTAERATSDLPYRGFFTFDSADIDWMSDNNLLDDVAFHEILHVLGFGTLWDDFNFINITQTGEGLEYVGEVATYYYNQEFPQSGGLATGIPLESHGGSGTARSHWNEEDFEGEIMTGYVNSNNYLSNISIAALEDLGYDTVLDNPFDPNDLVAPVPTIDFDDHLVIA